MTVVSILALGLMLTVQANMAPAHALNSTYTLNYKVVYNNANTQTLSAGDYTTYRIPGTNIVVRVKVVKNQIQPKPQPKPTPPPQQPTPTPPQQPAPTPPQQQPSQPSALTADEQRMYQLVNEERAKQGLKPLAVDMELVKLARLKAKDMIDNNYFSHTSPTYGSPFDMMKNAGISFRTAGENLAGANTVERAHTNLMNSPGHRANILNSSFTSAGIGVVNGGPYGKMFVQLFKG